MPNIVIQQNYMDQDVLKQVLAIWQHTVRERKLDEGIRSNIIFTLSTKCMGERMYKRMEQFLMRLRLQLAIFETNEKYVKGYVLSEQIPSCDVVFINVDVETEEEVVKTTIHEAFHIIIKVFFDKKQLKKIYDFLDKSNDFTAFKENLDPNDKAKIRGCGLSFRNEEILCRYAEFLLHTCNHFIDYIIETNDQTKELFINEKEAVSEDCKLLQDMIITFAAWRSKKKPHSSHSS